MENVTYRSDDSHPLYATALGTGTPLLLLHGGGPDHRSLLPLARLLADGHRLLLPDIRGYGRSRCPDPALHTWARYGHDVVALLDHLGLERAALLGTGLGGTIALRTAADHPTRVRAVIVAGLEDIEDDAGKAAETRMLEHFAARVRADGLAAAWSDVLPHLSPLIGALVHEAIPRADPQSVAAACALGYDRAFGHVTDLAAVTAPALIVPGADFRHPEALAGAAVAVLPRGVLGPPVMTEEVRTAEELGTALAPAVREFLGSLPERP
ncbi:alpha/beta hydrolase [Streptomyces sp. NPDC004539]|uniref:alpha/beta fold hydrolase n=1 Tax=Streptomyces sp. NPDC004539 TaxID=3154280 RepID=UPI0033B26ACB